ncbi:MAG: DNA alkylation repair protein, partial [Methylophaga sp.]|nr:DNA alkylation repair protein [Methylophaga sp.]
MSEQKLMKSGLSTGAVSRICTVLANIIDDFPQQQFRDEALQEIDDLELKQRVDHLIAVLAHYLPEDFQQTAEILLQVKLHWDWGDESDALSGFAAWPLIDYVAVHGLEQPEVSLNVLKELTPLFSAEFAIRPFIEQHFDFTYKVLLQWSRDADEHVRRLACEGIRPRLPWGKRLVAFCEQPNAIFPILEQLKDDPSLYVRKSVANNLNDIAKDNPEKVITLCQQWLKGASPDRQWIIHHALRSLVKQGREEVFPLLGYSEEVQLTINSFDLKSKTIHLGESLEIDVLLSSSLNQIQKLVVDYKIHHVKANGSTSSKVFK